MNDEIGNKIQIVKNLLQIGSFLQKTGNRLTGEFGLTQQQFVVLTEIAEKGLVSQKQIVGELLFEKSNVSKIVKKLHSKGLIHVSNPPEDARTTILSITNRGKNLQQDCLNHLNMSSEIWLDQMNENDIGTAVEVLGKLRKLIY